ncbi:hypothetical protein D9M73_293620 [compost metagenome]
MGYAKMVHWANGTAGPMTCSRSAARNLLRLRPILASRLAVWPILRLCSLLPGRKGQYCMTSSL